MRFLLALSFLTVIPVPLSKIMTEIDLGKSTKWFPLVGAVVGAILWLVLFTARLVWSPFVAGALTLAVWVILTRGLHLDGLADTVDGLGGGFTRERSLEIMKDSRVGAFGALSLFVLLSLKLSLLSSDSGEIILLLPLAPVIARWTMVLAISSFPPARKNGMGRRFLSYCGFTEIAVSSLLALSLCWILAGASGLVLMGIGGSVAFLVAWKISRSLGGLTGDSYGCICEIVEVSILLSGLPLIQWVGSWGSLVL